MSFLSRIRDQPYLLLTLTSLFWAGNAVVGRAIVEQIPPVALAQIRWTGAFY
ncbi:MAG: EamA/RhaT family transporter, partial [Pseudomonadota bacterium]|nr:EamA/RhaT family transporter [Pseudomonadota bacterium]